MPLFVQVEGQPTIVFTDWFTAADRTMTYEEIMVMVNQGVPLVKITTSEMTRILELPGPGSPVVHPPTPADPTGIGALADRITELDGTVTGLTSRLRNAGIELGR